MVDLLWNRKIYTKTYTNRVKIPESGIEIPAVMVLTLMNGDIATGNEMRIDEAQTQKETIQKKGLFGGFKR